MEVKSSVILSVLILSLFTAQADAKPKSCCPNTTARQIYNVCRMSRGSMDTCASMSGCKIEPSGECPSGFDKLTQDHGSGEARTEYCKLGCVYSVCNVISALQNSDGSEIVNGAVADCTNSCSGFCAKGFTDE